MCRRACRARRCFFDNGRGKAMCGREKRDGDHNKLHDSLHGPNEKKLSCGDWRRAENVIWRVQSSKRVYTTVAVSSSAWLDESSINNEMSSNELFHGR